MRVYGLCGIIVYISSFICICKMNIFPNDVIILNYHINDQLNNCIYIYECMRAQRYTYNNNNNKNH